MPLDINRIDIHEIEKAASTSSSHQTTEDQHDLQSLDIVTPENPPMDYLVKLSKNYGVPILLVSIWWITISKKIEDNKLEENNAIYYDILNAYSLSMFFTLVKMPSIIKFTTDIFKKICKLDFIAGIILLTSMGLVFCATYIELKKIECLNNHLDDEGKGILDLLKYCPTINNSLLILLLINVATKIGESDKNIHMGKKLDDLSIEKHILPVFSSIFLASISCFALVSNPLQPISLIQREQIDSCPNSLGDSRNEILLSMITLFTTFGAVSFNGITAKLAQDAVKYARFNNQSNVEEKLLCLSTIVAFVVSGLIKFMAIDTEDRQYTPTLPPAFSVIHALLTTTTISACDNLRKFFKQEQKSSTVLTSRAKVNNKTEGMRGVKPNNNTDGDNNGLNSPIINYEVDESTCGVAPDEKTPLTKTKITGVNNVVSSQRRGGQAAKEAKEAKGTTEETRLSLESSSSRG